MRTTFVALILSLLASSTFAKEYPAGYWEKNYNTGESPVASYSVTVQVSDIAKATMEADRRITKAGGSLTNMNSYDAGGRPTKNLNYSVDAKIAEGLAKAASRVAWNFFQRNLVVGS